MDLSLHSKRTLSALAVVCAVAFSGPANATLLLGTGLIGGSGDVDNVLFNPCGLGSSSGTTVQGCLNSSHSTLVDFTGHETLAISGGGQAVIGATDGALDYFKIALDNPALGFGKLQFNLDAIANGTATFRAIDQFGTLFNFGSFALNGRGQNFFTLYSLDNQVATSFELISTVGIQNISKLEQVRLGPTALDHDVPEPATLSMFGLGLLGLAALRRRKNT